MASSISNKDCLICLYKTYSKRILYAAMLHRERCFRLSILSAIARGTNTYISNLEWVGCITKGIGRHAKWSILLGTWLCATRSSCTKSKPWVPTVLGGPSRSARGGTCCRRCSSLSPSTSPSSWSSRTTQGNFAVNLIWQTWQTL